MPASRPEILSLAPMLPAADEALEQAYTVHKEWEVPAAELAAWRRERAPHVRALVTNGALGAGAALLDALPALEIIACHGVGVDAIDLERARARGIPVTVTPDVLTEDVADMGLALLLATARQIPAGDRFVRAGRWLEGAMPLTRRLSGKRVGIVGLGRIGRALARRLEPLGTVLSYHDVRAQPGAAYPFVADLVELARGVDYLVVTAAGGPGTRGLVNASVLDALGPDGVLVNVARGSIVDEEALVRALREGRLGGAGLDVFADEPRVPEPLREMPHVVLQPHHASGTVEGRAQMGALVVRNLAAHFAGEPLPTPYAG